jgi:hypothetical protein
MSRSIDRMLTWIRQTFSGYACKLSASVSTATQLALRNADKKVSSCCCVSTTHANIWPTGSKFNDLQASAPPGFAAASAQSQLIAIGYSSIVAFG